MTITTEMRVILERGLQHPQGHCRILDLRDRQQANRLKDVGLLQLQDGAFALTAAARLMLCSKSAHEGDQP